MTYDVVVIGAGTGGLTAARLLAGSGKRVALVEKARPGGDCLWTGCVPTKAMLHAAARYHDAANSAAFGTVADDVRLDFAAVREHIRRSQEAAGKIETPEVIRSWGVTLIEGTALFQDPHTVDVDGQRISGRSFIIATGSRAAVPSIDGLDSVPFDTNTELLEWDSVPGTLVVLGGGAIGVEFSQAMARFGSQVTIVERESRLLGPEEPDASALVESALAGEGITVLTGASGNRVSTNESGSIEVEVEKDDTKRTLVAERLLVATGRRPNTESLGLEAAGVAVSKGAITVDSALRTSQPHIFAVGDVNGGPQFTHVSESQARTVVGSINNQGRRFALPSKWNGRVVPRVTFTDPEVASVGLTEREARKRHRGVRTWNLPLERVDRAVTMGRTDGFIRIITARGWQNRIPGLASKVGDEIVGACIVAPSAGDLLMPIVVAMRMRLPVGVLAWNMQAYPTLSLGVRQAAGLPFDPGA